MAKAKQLPSGSWRIRVYDKIENKYVSFTSQLPGKAGKATAELMAREYQLGIRKKIEKSKTVGDCIDSYIESKENILSPSTIDGYKRIKKNSLAELCDISVSELSALDIQKHINELSLTKSPKTVISAHGLLVAVLKVYVPELNVRTTLPKKQKKIKQLPAVKDVIRAIKGTDIEIPCLLAIWCTLRMSEVRGAKRSNIHGNILTIEDTVITVGGEHIERTATKTVESTRQVHLPDILLNLINALPENQEYLTEYTQSQIYKRFQRYLSEAGVQHISFHDLRHLDASVMAMLNIPEKYAMERGGWSSPHIMKSVYQHTFTSEREAIEEKIDDYFNSIYDTIPDTINDTSQNTVK